MDRSLMLLEQVALSNSHWSVFNLQDLTGSEELTGTVSFYTSALSAPECSP